MRQRTPVILGSVLAFSCVCALIRPRGLTAAASTETSSSTSTESPSLFSSSGEKNVDWIEATKARVAETVTAPGTIRAGSEVAVGAPFDGRILELAVDEGAIVKEGDLIFRLDPVEWEEKLRESQLSLEQKKAALGEAESEDREAARKLADAAKEPSELTEARLRRRQAVIDRDRSKAQLEAAETKLERATSGFKQNVISKVDVDSAEVEKNVSRFNLKSSEESLQLAIETESFRERSWKDAKASCEKALEVTKTRLERAKADLRAAEVAVERAKRDLERTRITSPLAGTVTGRNVNQGEFVARGGNGKSQDSVAQYIVSDLSHMLVYADVEEGDVAKVAPEQSVRIRVNALGDDVRLEGKVLDVAFRAYRKDDVATFQVRVVIDRPGNDDDDGKTTKDEKKLAKAFAKLRPAMTATADIETRSKDSAVLVPLPAVARRKKKELPESAWTRLDPKTKEQKKPDDLQDVIYVIEGDVARARAVALGLADSERVEIERGADANEKVVVGPYRTLESLKDGDSVKGTRKTDLSKLDSKPEAERR